MNKKTIKYIGFYDSSSNTVEKRNFRLSATNKMDYIIKALNEIGYDVEIISPSWTIKNKFYRGKALKIKDNVILRLFPTLPWYGKILKIISVIFSFSVMFFYLLFRTNTNEQVIIYHSKWMSLPILFLKKIKSNLTIVLEVEEVYSDVKGSKFWKLIEYKLFKVMDKYIFPTELLNKKLNIENKPYAIVYGDYHVKEISRTRFEDGKIHIVYAGTFDPKKGGALAAAAVAEYLPDIYHVHILGFGSNKEISLLLDKIEQVTKKSNATLTYDGLLKGQEYIEFLQKCDIGLSTQTPDATYNESSFPSKILSYMANGLTVVSARIKVIEISEIGNAVFYYNEQSPKDIADTILSIDINEVNDSRSMIKRLDKQFVKKLKKLLKNE